ncbi:MAG: hypothetical protein M3R46_12820 [Actinomycetota bacterium]|nr:hypothetical protein [Actinomycetota bacterium]
MLGLGSRMAALVGALALCAVLVTAVAAEPAAAEAPPKLRVTAGERAAEAYLLGWCIPPGVPVPGAGSCGIAGPPTGPYPALAVSPGSEVVIDTGVEAGAVNVALSRPDAESEGSSSGAQRLDARRWAFLMPTIATARATIDVEYAEGGDSRSQLTLRRIVAENDGRSSVAAYGDVVAWSEQRATSGGGEPDAVAPFDLMALVDGKVRRLGVAPRSVPFDVDVGPGEDGGVVAVYSRCADEPSPDDPGFVYARPYPAYTRGGGCDVYRVDVDGGKERKVAGASTDQASEVLPSIWRDEIAFARVYEQREGSRGRYPYLYVRPLAGGRSQRQPGGSRGASGLPGPTSIDLYGRRLSFVWNYRTGSGDGDTGGVSEVRLDTVGGEHRVLSQASHDGTRPGGAYASFLSPQGSEGRIFYGYGRVRVEDVSSVPVEPGGVDPGGLRVNGKPLSSLLLGYRLDDGDKELIRTPSEIAGVATTGRDRFYVAQRRDFVEQFGGATTIIDISDLPVAPGPPQPQRGR